MINIFAFVIDPFFGSLASAGAGAIGSVLGAVQSNKNTKRYIAAQAEENEKAYQRNLEMWNKQNEYNTPTAVVQRLRDAGLNPSLAYGTPNVSAPAPTAPIQDMSAIMNQRSIGEAVANSASDSALKAAQIDLMRSEASKNYSDASNKDVNTERDKISLRVEQALEDGKIELFGLEKEKIAGDLLIQDDQRNYILQSTKYLQGMQAYLEKSIEKIDSDIQVNEATRKNLNSKTWLNQIDSKTRDALNQSNIRKNIAVAKIDEKQYSELVATFLERHGLMIQQNEQASVLLDQMEEDLRQAYVRGDWQTVQILTDVMVDVAQTAGSVISSVGKVRQMGLPSMDDYVDNEEIITTKHDGYSKTSKTRTHHKVNNSWSE